MQLIEGGPRPPVFAEGGDFPAYGADAVRWGLLAISSSQDVRFNEERVAQGRQLANKLYNASRLVLLRAARGRGAARTAARRPRPSRTRWILSRLQAAERDVARGDRRLRLPRRRPAGLRLRLRRAVRLVPRAAQAAPVRGGQRSDAGEFALHVLAETLALAHPLIPFVTEEIWGHVPGADGLLMARRYPVADDALADPDAEAQLARAIEAVQELRAWRDSVGAAPGRPIPARLDGAGLRGDGRATSRGSRGSSGPPTAASRWRRWPSRAATVAVFASDAVDLEAEQRRAQARRAELEAEIARAEGKLANERFVAKAPEAVVQAERDKLARLREELAEL